jgi:hypothetical protein
MNNLTIQSELTLAGILTMYLYYYYLPILSNKKTGDLFPDRQLNEPSQFDYKNNPIPNMNNNPLIIIIRGETQDTLSWLFPQEVQLALTGVEVVDWLIVEV